MKVSLSGHVTRQVQSIVHSPLLRQPRKAVTIGAASTFVIAALTFALWRIPPVKATKLLAVGEQQFLIPTRYLAARAFPWFPAAGVHVGLIACLPDLKPFFATYGGGASCAPNRKVWIGLRDSLAERKVPAGRAVSVIEREAYAIEFATYRRRGPAREGLEGKVRALVASFEVASGGAAAGPAALR